MIDYVAFKAVTDRHLNEHNPKYKWGPALPREKWPEAKEQWLRKYVRYQALKQIKADHYWYARSFNPTNDWRYSGESDQDDD